MTAQQREGVRRRDGATPIDLSVRDLSAADLTRVAEIHGAAFPRSALSALGGEAVRRYYEWQLSGPHDAVAVGAFDGNELAGYGFAGVFRGAMSGFLRRNRAFLAGRLLLHPGAVADPIFRARMRAGLASLVRSRGVPNPAAESGRVASFGILAVATSPGCQGRGVGVAIMSSLEAAAIDRGFDRMHLSVNPDNIRAVRFYERLGWDRRHEGEEWKGLMTKTISRRVEGTP
jgi:ribosomal protein S18 acetylase RimI-like enzyme